jgi:hypothetical protein
MVHQVNGIRNPADRHQIDIAIVKSLPELSGAIADIGRQDEEITIR